MCKYAVIDLEMCKVPRKVGEEQRHCESETIQIGAVLLNESLEIEDQFVTYVLPQFGYIDTFIKNLTGINPSDVRDAPSMGEALQMFVDWLPEGVKVVSWSRNDEVQIRREAEVKNINIAGLDTILEQWIDCQEIFMERMHSEKCFGLTEALIAADISYKDGAHDGLVDAYNTALLFAKMEKEPELVLNPYYENAISGEENESFGVTMGNLFQNLNLQGLDE